MRVYYFFPKLKKKKKKTFENSIDDMNFPSKTQFETHKIFKDSEDQYITAKREFLSSSQHLQGNFYYFTEIKAE